MTKSQHASIWTDLTRTAFTQGYLDAGGIRTRYLAAGDEGQPLLILIHGTGGHAEAYSRNLAAHAEHFRTYAIDLVGHGWSDKPKLDYEIADYARHVIAVIKALGHQKAHISGESLGGWVAAWMAVHHPEWVDRVVLNTAGGWTAYPEVMERISRLTMEAVTDPSPVRIRTRLEFLMQDHSKVNDDLVEVRRAIYSQPGYPDIMKRILCLQQMDIRRRNMFSAADSASIKAPTLVLWTSHDPTAAPEEGRKIADAIPGAQFHVMNECGHWPQFEDPETFNRIHLDFLLGR
ncbi:MULTISPECIES: alpha/beta fold hydrolase [Alphaproteobacteria]|jgi:2-hydroxy-6-oxonona-2,4-dienedioate hydrolase|uniref:2-hydroxy-6-ketonona-2,4-dienedioic acid hydrolase n=2 Tax=Alphaproteobacteria TaxID=28211 RepID=A0A512HNH4_9HYPH|nr:MULTISPECIES: alpha/beta fold hydrolase [Alphaproteobacteria]GEO86979.1 2-hydroxy-6-ketonona-2,4-dienedioic acid hydrolase [Ciceribacter naphthalenivorans]GLR23321.1 2-hydroxy-6-ketonona-2,4-dienedioic acid hydrolase [Ciceribacter naphthalenivorans]GLT06177.1 2-hydroxy-6-ketonona-2,4-dienedioic acid hydrolase [Sphingomonas psychrolutea]